MKSFYYKQPYADEQVRATINGQKTLMVFPVTEWQKPSLNKNFDGRFPDLRWISIAQKDARFGFAVFGETESSCMNNYNEGYSNLCPFFNVGERYWLKESYSKTHLGFVYRADGVGPKGIWNSSVHMPQHASRCTIEVKRVYVKRIDDATESESMRFIGNHKRAMYFRAANTYEPNWVMAFRNFMFDWCLGDRLSSNPWCWFVEFEVMK